MIIGSNSGFSEGAEGLQSGGSDRGDCEFC